MWFGGTVNGVGTDAGTRSLTSSPWPSKVAESLKSGIHKTSREETVKKEESEEGIFRGYNTELMINQAPLDVVVL